MDRLFGKELSNLLHPHPIASHGNAHKIPSKSTRDPSMLGKDVQRRPETRSTSVHQDKKVQNASMSTESQEKSDKSLAKDVQLVPEYFDQCLNFMLGQEEKNYSLSNYMKEQPTVNDKMRGILLDWIV